MKPFLFLIASIFVFSDALAKKGDLDLYKRDHFQHWIDMDKDCQNTRAEILIERSKVPVSFRRSKKGNCTVDRGEWKDFYFEETLQLASQVDIDHVVPLKHAWEVGANVWTADKRKDFANDPLNLVITNRKYNRQKGAKTILEWMPIQKSYACEYVKRWFAVKEKYQLQISERELEYQKLLACPI
jgi:hypothetical protein